MFHNTRNLFLNKRDGGEKKVMTRFAVHKQKNNKIIMNDIKIYHNILRIKVNYRQNS